MTASLHAFYGGILLVIGLIIGPMLGVLTVIQRGQASVSQPPTWPDQLVSFEDLAQARRWTDLPVRSWDLPLPTDHADVDRFPGHEVLRFDLQFHGLSHDEEYALTVV